jgi:aminomethyltransferase
LLEFHSKVNLPSNFYLWKLTVKEMKNTPLTPVHEALGAKMAEFAGYNMPIVYSGIMDEHHAVRQRAGIFDVSHMGEFVLKGDEALPFLQKMVSNDIAKLERGQAMYGYLPNTNGGIVDDLLVYHLDDGNYMAVVNASNIEKDWNWFQQHNTNGAEIHNISDRTALLAVQGPEASGILQQLTEINLSNIPYYRMVRGKLAGVENMIISATGYTGAGGFELYFHSSHAESVWSQIMEAGKEKGILPCGLGARDTLRLEMGYCLYGNDIDDTTSPLEAGLGWVTKFKKDFIGKNILEAQKATGLQHLLVGFEMIDRGIPRHDYPIADAEGKTIGKVTSGSQSPSLGKAIGLGYVAIDHAKTGRDIYIDVRGKLLQAQVVKTPFVK